MRRHIRTRLPPIDWADGWATSVVHMPWWDGTRGPRTAWVSRSGRKWRIGCPPYSLIPCGFQTGKTYVPAYLPAYARWLAKEPGARPQARLPAFPRRRTMPDLQLMGLAIGGTINDEAR